LFPAQRPTFSQPLPEQAGTVIRQLPERGGC
jgi:hypothetical protein